MLKAGDYITVKIKGTNFFPGDERIVILGGLESLPTDEEVKTYYKENLEIEKIVEGPRRPKVIEAPATGDLLGAATLIANSELNVNDLSTTDVLTMLKDLSQEEVNKQLGFWAIPLPKDGDVDPVDDKPRYLKK